MPRLTTSSDATISERIKAINDSIRDYTGGGNTIGTSELAGFLRVSRTTAWRILRDTPKLKSGKYMTMDVARTLAEAR